jgi:hypothetical protein
LPLPLFFSCHPSPHRGPQRALCSMGGSRGGPAFAVAVARSPETTPTRSGGEPTPFSPRAFLPVLREAPRSRVRPPKPASLQANPHPQTIFPAFTQQNRMSSPPTHQKSNNSNSINKIKLSPKRFLVIVNQVQLKLEIKKAPAQRWGFFRP